ncbi:MAG: hypothetical protein LBT64_00285 [Puniceicoccales bacterium]|nr:hypothetical protein [Puniceicoccales bacterium]
MRIDSMTFIVEDMSMDELRNEVAKIFSSSGEDAIDPSAMMGANADDAESFAAALGKSSGDFGVAGQNLDQAYVNLSDKNVGGARDVSSLADSIRAERVKIPAVEEKMIQASREAAGTDYEGKLSGFVSTVRKKLQETADIVKNLSKKNDLSQKDLMEIQFHVMEMSIVLDVASKVGDKGSQALQTLFRDK